MSYLVPYSVLVPPAERQDESCLIVSGAELRRLIAGLIIQIVVDEQWYRHRYRDVAEAVDAGHVNSARDHYIEAGYFEGRLPRPVSVDEEWYLEMYPDVAYAVRRGRFENGQEHFDRDGFREGRLPSSGWRL